MSSYSSSLRYLYSLQSRGIKFGLRNVRYILQCLGNPEKAYPTVHIAGTNGKGSTASFIASVFQEAGHRTGLYTSPHLERFTERIKINGREIPEKRLIHYTQMIRPLVERVGATFFEATTSIAFLYFADEGVDVAVIETGLGGRLDATNVATPMVSAITNIGLEHQDYLGKTIRKIASEKGGIIKPRVPVVLGDMLPEAERTLKTIARRRKARVTRVRDLSDSLGWVDRAEIGLGGGHQKVNARSAAAVFSVLQGRPAFRRMFGRISLKTVASGLRNVAENTGLRGRLEYVGRGRKLLVDVAHNPDGMRTLVRSLMEQGQEDLTVVFGVMKDKDYRQMLRELRLVARRIVAVAPAMERALEADKIVRAAARLGIPATFGGTVRQGLRKASGPGRILVTGSHFVVGEAFRAIRSKNA